MSLPLDKVQHFEYKDYKYQYTKQTTREKGKNNDIRDYREPGKTMLSVDGGFSFEIGKISESIPDDLKDYTQQLRSGYNFSVGITSWFDEEVGVGFKYQNFLSRNELHGDLTLKYGKLSDNVKVSLYAPSINLRVNYRNGTSFFNNYYLGYISYKNEAVVQKPCTIKGGTVAAGIDGGYEVELGDHFLLAFQGSLVAGVLKKVNIYDGGGVRTMHLEKGSYESLYRVDFSIGLRFR
jgi:hypothetical protein